MSLCASCGLQLSGDAALCPHHHCVYGDDWAVANRIMCDLVHRAIVPRRLAPNDRDQVALVTDDEGEVVLLAAS